MKNKKIYIIVILILLGLMIFFLFKYFKNDSEYINDINNTSSGKINSNDLDENIKTINEKDKIINSDTVEINPNNYESVEEFLGYLNTGSGINLNVDLLEENFYINVYSNDDTYVVTKFDKELISEIDNSVNKNFKNQAILDIFDSYETDGYIHGEPNSKRSGVRLLEEHELPSNMRLHNSILLPYSGESFIETTKRLENKKHKTKEDIHQLSYLYDFSGDYKKSLKYKKKTGIKKIKYTIKGRVSNLGKLLKGAKVELLNYENIFTFTNEKGEYVLEFDIYPMSRLRLRASFDNLSDGYNGVYVVFDFDNQKSDEINFTLQNINTKVLIKASDLKNNKTKIVKSSIGNTFEFKEGILLDKNGKIYNGDFNVMVFEFNRNTPGMENFLRLDNFDDLYGYTGNMMITNGMTYLSVTDLEGNELFISKRNPILTRQKVDIDYLLHNKQNGTTILTQEQLNLILEKSKQDGYPIDNKFLSERSITGFAPWWVLNRTKGIWENNGIKLLNKDGLKESLYYNVD